MEAVPRMPMLSFELKHSPEYVEFGPTLKAYIRDHYGEDPAHYNKGCNELEQLRQSAVHVSHDFMGCSTLKKYYSQLQFLQGRFPMLEGGEASIPFTWEEVFSGREMTLADIKFEQACILYNIGALHSVLGAMDTRQSADGMKVSCTHFQCASWAFEHLRDHFGCAAMSLDMTHELLTFQLSLMLAQAQECILEKSMTDSRKSTITAKVASQIVEFYRASLKHLDVCNSQELISSKRYKDWKKRIDLKILFYTCITNFYMGRQSEDQQKHGQCLAYYTVALDKLTECEKLAKNEGVEIQDSLRFTHDVVGGKHQSAKKDNDFVYHDKVPPVDSLPEVKGASLVKGIPFNANDPEISGPDIFQKLVPMSAHEAASLYSEEKATLIRRVVSDITEKNDELNQYLASLQLDQTALNPEPERLPQPLLEKCAALSVRPTAIKELVDSMTAVSNVATEVDLGIQEIQQTLQDESKAELEFQDTFGKRNPNAILSEIAQECARLEEGHKKGSQSNTDLHKAMNTHINNLKLLGSPLEDLQKLLPSVNKERDPESNDVIKQLNNLLSKIEEMRTQRQTLEDRLRKEVLDDDITGVLCKQETINREVLFAEQLKKHDNTSGLIRQNLAAQNNILKALTDANAKYGSVRKATSEAIARREQTIRDLINSYDVYEDLKAKSQKGLDFYRKLETNVGRLLTRCKNVCKVQQEDRQKMYNRYKPKAPVPAKPVAPKAQAPVEGVDDAPLADTPGVSHQPAHSVAAMFDGPKLKDYLPFMKPKTFGKKDGSPPISTAHPRVQDYMAQGGSLPNSGTASPIHFPQMSDSVPASPDHVRRMIDEQAAAARGLSRQQGPDLTQGHLYQPPSLPSQIPGSGQPQLRGQQGQGPGTNPQVGNSMYNADLQMQQQMGQGQIGYIQGQDGVDLSNQTVSQPEYIPLDQRWKKDKAVTPQAPYTQPGQRPMVSRSLKPQAGQPVPSSMMQQQQHQLGQDQQNFYTQSVSPANQTFGQQGSFQSQNIPNQPMQGQNIQSQPMQGQNIQNQPIQGQNIQSQPMQGQNIQNQPVQGQNIQSQPMQGQNIQSQPMQGQNIQSQSMPGQNIASQPMQGQNIQSQSMPGQNIASQPMPGQNIASQPMPGQNIASQPMHGQQIPSSLYGQAVSYQSQPFSQAVPQSQFQSTRGGQMTSYNAPVQPPQSMPVSREVTNTVSAVGGPVVSPGNKSQDFRDMSQATLSQGYGQTGQQQVGQRSVLGGQVPMHSTQQFIQGGQQPIQGGQQVIQGGQQPVQGGQQVIQGGQHSVQGGQQVIQAQVAQTPMQGGQLPMHGGQPMQSGQPPVQSAQQPIQGRELPMQGGQGGHPGGQYQRHTASPQMQHIQNTPGQTTPIQTPMVQPYQPQGQIQGQVNQNHPQLSQAQVNSQSNGGIKTMGQTTSQGQYSQGYQMPRQQSNIPHSGQVNQLPGQQSGQGQQLISQQPALQQAGQGHELPGQQLPYQQHQQNYAQQMQPASVGAVNTMQTGPTSVSPQHVSQPIGGQQNMQRFQQPQVQGTPYPQAQSPAQSIYNPGIGQGATRFQSPALNTPQQNVPVSQHVPAQNVSSQYNTVQPGIVGGQGQLGRSYGPTPVSSQTQSILSLSTQGQSGHGLQQQQQQQTPLQGQYQQLQPSSQGNQGQTQFVQGPGLQQPFTRQQVVSQAQKPQAPNYSETLANRQFTYGQMPGQTLPTVQIIGQTPITSQLPSQNLPPGQFRGQTPPVGQIPSQTPPTGQFRGQTPPPNQMPVQTPPTGQFRGQTPPTNQMPIQTPPTGQFRGQTASTLTNNQQVQNSQQFQQQQQQNMMNQLPSIPNQSVNQTYGGSNFQGKVPYGQSSQINQAGVPQYQQNQPQCQIYTSQPVLQPQVIKPNVVTGVDQSQYGNQTSQQNRPLAPPQGQSHIAQQQPQVQQPVQPQQPAQSQPQIPAQQSVPTQPPVLSQQPVQTHQPTSPMVGNYQQGRNQDQYMRAKSPVETVSHSTPSRNIPVNRQISTASSLDEILSSSPNARTETDESVLAPKVLTAQDIQQQKEDQLKNSSLHIQPIDPYKDKSKQEKFVAEVEKLAKFVEGFEKPLCSGPTPLDVVWKELMDEQEKAGRKQKLAIARCYPMKNRDQDIMPYDDSRVLLTTLNDDYINASWINDLSPSCPKFIATQAPLAVTLIDYWLMVYEQGVEVLVALSGDTETGKKFPPYLPSEKGKTMEHGPVQLTLQSIKYKQCWTERILHLRHAETRSGRTLVHLEYSHWPVSGFPEKTSHILQFITEVHSFYRQQRSLLKPIVVHCGNGVGRTGMFQLIYVGMQEINHGDGIVNIQEVGGKMLWRRRNLLLKQDQLKFCYEAILYYAQDVLAKEGILVHKASFGDELPKPGAKPTGWEPGQDILFGSMSFSNLQSNIAKMTAKSDSDSSHIDRKLEMLKNGDTSVVEGVLDMNIKEEKVIPEGQVVSIIGGNSLPDVVQNPGINLERISTDSLLDLKQDVDKDLQVNETVKDKTEELFSDFGIQKLEEKGSLSSLISHGSNDSKGSRGSSAFSSPAHQSRDVSNSPKPEKVSSSLAELQDPTKFTIGTSEGCKRKITKANFTDEGRQAKDLDPNDPFNTLDPLWTHK